MVAAGKGLGVISMQMRLRWLPVLAALVGLWPAGFGARAAEPITVNAMEYPWSAIGRVNIGGRGFCTGFLVGDNEVLTAQRCLYDAAQGRWWHPDDLHFVAGYQHDNALLHAAVRRIDRAPRGFGVRADGGEAAILTLAEPLGLRAGWLGLHPLEAATFQRLRRGEGGLLVAGYRRGVGHALSASLGCTLDSLDREGVAAFRCGDINGLSGAPLLLSLDGEIRAVGIHVAYGTLGDVQAQLSQFARGEFVGRAVTVSAHEVGARLAGRAPAFGGTNLAAAAPVPIDTIDALLQRLGFGGLETAAGPTATRMATPPAATPAVTSGGRAEAIAAYQSQRGIRVTGQPSTELLARLVEGIR